MNNHALFDEDHTLSDDSDCISDCSEDHTEVIDKYISPSEVNALNGRTKQCAIYFYYLVSSDYAVPYAWSNCQIQSESI